MHTPDPAELPDWLAGHHADVELPSYDRTQITPGWVHLGVGGFHRAHQAVYLDDLLASGASTDWGICGVGVLPQDEPMRDALQAQDGLYTILVKGSDGRTSARVIGSMVEYLFAPRQTDAVIARLGAPETRVVSLTVTEGGYNIDPTTGAFRSDNPDIVHDLENQEAPRTHFGLITAALRARRDGGVPPFTVLSCDNIQGNGRVARRAFIEFASMLDTELRDWIADNVAFPNTMVDRITPVTTDAHRDEVAGEFGISDAWPVVCEPFRQWVVEDEFPAGRPPLENSGVQFVEDVVPYELMKLRILNASHQLLGCFGRLCDYEYVHDACADEQFRSLILRYMEDEATPTLQPVDGVDLDEYRRTVLDRFTNPAIGDTMERMCLEKSTMLPTFLLPVLRDNLERGGAIRRSVAAVASWARFCEGVDENGQPIRIVDRQAAELTARAGRHDQDILAFVRGNPLFDGLEDDPRFVAEYTAALRTLRRGGARQLLAELASEPPPASPAAVAQL